MTSFVRSLDLVLFSGGDAVSSLIRFMQGRKLPDVEELWSHVGLVVRSDVLDDPRVKPGKAYVLESTFSGAGSLGGARNVDGDWADLGVQLRELDAVVDSYDGKVAVARLAQSPLDVDDPEELKRLFTQIFRFYEDRPYEQSPVSLCGSLLGCCRCVRNQVESRAEGRRSLFCSELVAAVYRDLGVLPADLDTRDVVPMDFLPGCDLDRPHCPAIVRLPLLRLHATKVSRS